MDINPESSLHSFLSPSLLLVLSFLDDALVLGLSRLGLHIPGLEWLYPVFISCGIVYGVVQLCRHWQRFRQRSPVVEESQTDSGALL
jgi:hypothetical protein